MPPEKTFVNFMHNTKITQLLRVLSIEFLVTDREPGKCILFPLKKKNFGHLSLGRICSKICTIF
jgi:hypothetical protein